MYGGAEQGACLARHVSVDELHLTGSDATHDAIVWGPPGPEREARQRRGEPLCGKPVSSELGNVSPVIVVPGPYSEREIAYQVEDIASYVVMNAGFLCNAAGVLITPRQWAPRTPFLRHLERVLQSVPPRKSYYPGAADRWWRLTDGRDQAIRIGRAEGDTLPWTVIPGLDAADRNEPLFTREAFCPVVAETSVGSSDPVEFLERAVEFANERLWGMSFAFGTPPWGAYPGATSLDIQSGAPSGRAWPCAPCGARGNRPASGTS